MEPDLDPVDQPRLQREVDLIRGGRGWSGTQRLESRNDDRVCAGMKLESLQILRLDDRSNLVDHLMEAGVPFFFEDVDVRLANDASDVRPEGAVERTPDLLVSVEDEGNGGEP